MKIDELVHKEKVEEYQEIPCDEEIFESQEQIIGIELLNTKSSKDIFNLYSKYVDKKEELEINSLIMIVYFFGKSELIEHDLRIKEILLKIIENKDELDVDMLVSFTYGLQQIKQKTGQFIDKLLDQNKQIRDYISQNIKQKYQELNINNCAVMALGINQIFDNDQYESKELIKLIVKTFIENLQSTESVYILKIIQEMGKCGLRNDQIDVLGKELIKRKDELSFQELCLAIDSFEFCGYYEEEFYIKMSDGLLMGINKMNDVNELCRAICCLSTVMGKQKEQIKRLLRIVHANYEQINNQGYSDIWIGLGRLGCNEEYNEKTIDILKKCVREGKGVRLSEMENWEVANLLLAFAVLRLDDEPFVSLFVAILEDQLTNLDTQELVNLGRSFVVYVRQFEEFYIRVHDQLQLRYKYLSEDDKAALHLSFSRASILFPYSPFIKSL